MEKLTCKQLTLTASESLDVCTMSPLPTQLLIPKYQNKMTQSYL